MNADEISPEWISNILLLAKKAREVCETSNKRYEFTCPVCGGNARASKSSFNGHIHAACSQCDMSFME